MTQILTPYQDAIRDRREIGRAARQSGMNRRMCWTCQQDKPIKGGTYPGQGKSQHVVQRFRCFDCGVKRLARLAAKAESGD